MKRILLTVGLIVAFALPVSATTDLGNGVCLQDDGQLGLWDGSTADDDGCTTGPEYAVMFGPEALDHVVSSNPEWEPDAPTVREWFELLLSSGPR